jgi:uncharacterized protein
LDFSPENPAWRFRSLGRLIFAGYLLLAAVGVYGFWIEPYSIEVTRHRFPAPVTRPVKIAQVSDLHTRGYSGRERRLLEILDAEKPDAVILTGDYITVRSDWYRVRDVLARFKAPLGVWVVRGNWEDTNTLEQEARPRVNDELAFYREAGVRLLVNESAKLTDGVWIAGFDDALKGTPDIGKALAGIPAGAFRLAAFHSPVLFDALTGQVDLALAGHTHGGQVRFPGIGHLYLPPGSGRFLQGWYEAGSSRMYVSRGIGTTLIDMRLLCPPELPIFELVPR